MKFGCAICVFLNSEKLICRSTDISKCFRGSLQLRDNESRLYVSVEVIRCFSLGASHDGVGNMCVQGYAMEGTFLFANKFKWVFSSCSVNYIRNYLNGLNRLEFFFPSRLYFLFIYFVRCVLNVISYVVYV